MTALLVLGIVGLVVWALWLQIELMISRRVIRAFQQSAIIVPRNEKKARTPLWWLLFILPLLPWLVLLLLYRY